MILEACVETLEQAIRAERLGAHRVELCSRLDLDGLTPDLELAQKVRDAISIPIHVMIRPFPRVIPDVYLYDDPEKDEILKSIDVFKTIGMQGFVVGVLDQNLNPDLKTLTLLAKASEGYNLTFHKAIDLCPDPLQSLNLLKTIDGITHVLTSGGAATAQQGIDTLRSMLEVAGTIELIVAGRVTNENLGNLHASLGARAYHGKRIVGELN